MTVDFSGYLNAICNNPQYTQWWNTYTVTDVVGKEKRRSLDEVRSQKFEVRSELPAFSPLLDLGLMVQTVPKKDERENREEEQEKIERFGVLEGLQKYAANHVLLRGKPGSGKSTALIRLLLEESEEQRLEKIPVLVELRSYKTSVLDLIQNYLSQNQLFVNTFDIKSLLKEGKLLLLVDGVNELPSDAAYRDLQQFEQQYPQTAMIFTTRELGLRGDLNIEKKLTMEPLTEPQMQQFVKGYLPEEQAEGMLKQLGGRIKELGETPLLLWMLCSVFVQNQQEIPDNLGGVFQAFTRIYDDKLKADVTTQSNSRILWSDSLKYLAFEMTKRKDEPAISATEAETILGEFLVKAGERDYSLRRCRLWLQDLLNYHLLQRRGQDEIEFRHQLIQEYYTAETLVLEFDKLTDEQLQWNYLNYLKWTEPMAVVAGLLREEKQAVRLVKLGLEVDLKLGARLAGEVQQKWQEKTVELIDDLDISPLFKIELLGETHSHYALQSLSKFLQFDKVEIQEAVVKNLGKINYDDSTKLLIQSLNPKEYQIFLQALRSLKKVARENIIDVVEPYLKYPDFWIQYYIIDILGELRTQKSIELLLNLYVKKSQEPPYLNQYENVGYHLMFKIGNELENICNSPNWTDIIEYLDNKTIKIPESIYHYAKSRINKKIMSIPPKFTEVSSVLPALFMLGFSKDEEEKIEKNDIDILAKLLKDNDKEKRKLASYRLQFCEGKSKVIQLLFHSLKDNEMQVYRNALSSIKKIMKEIPNEYLISKFYEIMDECKKCYQVDENLSFIDSIQQRFNYYQNLCLPHLKISQNSLISDSKLTEYCLQYRQHHDKSKQLTQAGFSLSNPQKLKEAIKQLITENIVSQHEENDYGILYHVKGELNSVNDEKLTMITVWLKRKFDQKIQFISLKIISNYD